MTSLWNFLRHGCSHRDTAFPYFNLEICKSCWRGRSLKIGGEPGKWMTSQQRRRQA